MSGRSRGAATWMALGALALTLEAGAALTFGPALVARVRGADGREWLAAARITGRALTHAAGMAGEHVVGAAERLAFHAPASPLRLVALARGRACTGSGCPLCNARARSARAARVACEIELRQVDRDAAHQAMEMAREARAQSVTAARLQVREIAREAQLRRLEAARLARIQAAQLRALRIAARLQRQRIAWMLRGLPERITSGPQDHS